MQKKVYIPSKVLGTIVDGVWEPRQYCLCDFTSLISQVAVREVKRSSMNQYSINSRY